MSSSRELRGIACAAVREFSIYIGLALALQRNVASSVLHVACGKLALNVNIRPHCCAVLMHLHLLLPLFSPSPFLFLSLSLNTFLLFPRPDVYCIATETLRYTQCVLCNTLGGMQLSACCSAPRNLSISLYSLKIIEKE